MFSLGFEKIAKPRWAREALSLSKGSLNKIQPLVKAEREIKPLGAGRFNQADLVMHKDYGMSVRKTPHEFLPKNRDAMNQKLNQMSAVGRKNYLSDTRKNLQERNTFWKDVKRADPQGNTFANIKGFSGAKMYQEPVTPGPREMGGRLDKAYGKWLGTKTGLNTPERINVAKSTRKGLLTPEERQNITTKDPSYFRKQTRLERIGFKELPSLHNKPEVQTLKQKYPDLKDLRHVNTVGGKIIDAEPR